jgi:hypothetical protein
MDFPGPAGPYQEENTTRAEFNALNKGKFDEKSGDHRFTASFCNELHLIKRPWQQFWEVFR